MISLTFQRFELAITGISVWFKDLFPYTCCSVCKWESLNPWKVSQRYVNPNLKAFKGRKSLLICVGSSVAY